MSITPQLKKRRIWNIYLTSKGRGEGELREKHQDLEMSANSPPQGAPSPRERSHHWTVLSAERPDPGLRKYRLNPRSTTDEPWDLGRLYDFFTSASFPINNVCLIRLFQELKEIICRA